MIILPEDARRIISHSASLDGTLRFGGCYSVWDALGNWQDTPREAGLYMVGLTLGIQYERAVSRIAYIGSTRNLRTRIQTHNSYSHNCNVEMLKARYPAGLLVTWIALPGLRPEWLRALEDAALQEAKRQFGLYPICNMGRIDSPNIECCGNLISIFPCDGLPFPRSIEILSKQLYAKSLGRLPDRKPPEYWAEESTTTPSTKAPEWQTSITDENVATWNLATMERLVEACAELKPVPKQGKSKVRTFAAPTRQPPTPQTWGEVALIQARIVAGTWFPVDRLWVKVVCEKELLGQAIFESYYYRGEDKRHSPRVRQRSSIWSNKAWLKEADAIKGELPSNFVPQQIEIAAVPKVDAENPAYAEHVRLLEGSRACDIAIAGRDAELERQAAIGADKNRRLRDILNARIEATFLEAIAKRKET
jgi:hypothetical protein